MICWAVKTLERNIQNYTICDGRNDAIKAMEKYWGTWKTLYNQGFRCVKVKVEEVE